MLRLNEPDRKPAHNGVAHDLATRSDKARHGGRVGIRDRIACFQWTWFTSTMATGGVANVIAAGASPRARPIQ